MTDLIFHSFLACQLLAGKKLADQSDVLNLKPLFDNGPAEPPFRYIAEYSCVGALLGDDGQTAPRQADFHVGITFPSDYLRRVDPARIITWLEPANIQHPNIAPPYLCAGHIRPGTELVGLLYQIFEIIVYVNWAAHDSLNSVAAAWARQHQDLFPLDRRPLKRRALDLNVTPLPNQNKEHEGNQS